MPQNLSGTLFDDIFTAIKDNKLLLPIQPEVAIEMQQLSEKQDMTVNDLKKVLGKDPALTARIIRLANSPLARGLVPINSLDTAINRLGFRFVNYVALGLAMRQLFVATHKIIEEKMKAVWLHCSEVSAASYVLAAHTKLFPPEEALVAGLLHEIGILPILTFAESYPALRDDALEIECLIQNHSQNLGKVILSAWHFPEQIINVIENMNNVNRIVDKPDLADIVLIAKMHVVQGTNHPLAKIEKENIPAYARLGMDRKKDFYAQPHLQVALQSTQQAFA